MEALADLISCLPSLAEVSGDDFSPTRADTFYRLWGAIDRHPRIKANDCPNKDFLRLKLKLSALSREHRELLARVKRRSRPSTVAQRREFVVQQLRQQDSAMCDETEIFALATLIPDELGHALNLPDLGAVPEDEGGEEQPDEPMHTARPKKNPVLEIDLADVAKFLHPIGPVPDPDEAEMWPPPEDVVVPDKPEELTSQVLRDLPAPPFLPQALRDDPRSVNPFVMPDKTTGEDEEDSAEEQSDADANILSEDDTE
jgi:hypothetical protein